MFANPRKNHLFSVKMMRIDTVAGLLTTALSRTYPPLIPVHIQEMFQNPSGKDTQDRVNALSMHSNVHPKEKEREIPLNLHLDLDRALVPHPHSLHFT